MRDGGLDFSGQLAGFRATILSSEGSGVRRDVEARWLYLGTYSATSSFCCEIYILDPVGWNQRQGSLLL